MYTYNYYDYFLIRSTLTLQHYITNHVISKLYFFCTDTWDGMWMNRWSVSKYIFLFFQKNINLFFGYFRITAKHLWFLSETSFIQFTHTQHTSWHLTWTHTLDVHFAFTHFFVTLLYLTLSLTWLTNSFFFSLSLYLLSCISLALCRFCQVLLFFFSTLSTYCDL